MVAALGDDMVEVCDFCCCRNASMHRTSEKGTFRRECEFEASGLFALKRATQTLMRSAATNT